MPKMLGIKPLFEMVYRKLCGGLSIKPVGEELAHPGRRNVDCDLLAVTNSRAPNTPHRNLSLNLKVRA